MAYTRFYTKAIERIDSLIFHEYFRMRDESGNPLDGYDYSQKRDEEVAELLNQRFGTLLQTEITSRAVAARRYQLGFIMETHKEGWDTRRENLRRKKQGKPPIKHRKAKPEQQEQTLFDEPTNPTPPEVLQELLQKSDEESFPRVHHPQSAALVPQSGMQSLEQLLQKFSAVMQSQQNDINCLKDSVRLLVAGKIKGSERSTNNNIKSVTGDIMPPRLNKEKDNGSEGRNSGDQTRDRR